MEELKAEPDTTRPTEAPKGQGGLEAEVMKLSPGKDDILVVNLDHEPSEEEKIRIKETVEENLGDVKVLIASECSIELIPKRSGHYGVWLKDIGWSKVDHGRIFSTSSIGVAHAQKDLFTGDVEVREFNDDGTPGEVV